MLRRQFLAQSVAATAGLARRSSAAEPTSVLDVGDEPILFLDDWCVQSSMGLKRMLHQPAKKGLIQEADGRPWDRGDCYATDGCLVCRDNGGRFHMTYRYIWPDPGVRELHPSIGQDKAHWFRQSLGYAVSDDGIRWRKPRLGLIDAPAKFKKQNEYPFQAPDGVSKDNNLGYPIDFAIDLQAHGNVRDPKRRFLLRVAQREDTHPFAKVVKARMNYAADWPDVVGDPKWESRLTPIRDGQLSGRGFKTIAGYDHTAKAWFQVAQDHLGSWVKRGGRDIARWTSPDLTRWEGPELVLPIAADESRRPEDWIEYMYLTAYRAGGPRSGAWLGQLEVFHGDRSDPRYQMPGIDGVWRKGTVELRLVLSRDAGKTWQRVGGKQTWQPHHQDDHGFDRLAFGAVPVRVKDELWFYYPAWDGDHLVFNRDGSLYKPGFVRTGRTARATLRLNGYVSLDAEDLGEIVTKPLKFTGVGLRVNLRAPTGELRAELRDADHKPIHGFATADCRPVTGDGVDLLVRWGPDADLAKLAGMVVRIRFTLKKAEFYSCQFHANT